MQSRIGAATCFFTLLGAVALGVYWYYQTPDEPPLAQAPTVVDDHKPLPPVDEFVHLAHTDPVEMLWKCLIRYQREVPGGFQSTLEKTEWVEGKAHPTEVVHIAARDEFARRPQVRMDWESGFRKDPGLGFEIHGALLQETRNAEGELEYDILTWRPRALKKLFSIGVASEQARRASRYCLRDAGIYRGMLRTYDAWKSLHEAGQLQACCLEPEDYDDELRARLAKLGTDPAGKPIQCLVVRRTSTQLELDPFEVGGKADADPRVVERDGFNEVTILIDVVRWLQVGTIVRRTSIQPPRLIAEYYFRNIELNPSFPPDTFTPEGLKADRKTV